MEDWRPVTWLVIRVLFAVAVVSSAIELVDQSGVTGDDSPVASAAETIRTISAGELPGDWSDEIDSRLSWFRRIGSGFDDVTRALE